MENIEDMVTSFLNRTFDMLGDHVSRVEINAFAAVTCSSLCKVRNECAHGESSACILKVSGEVNQHFKEQF